MNKGTRSAPRPRQSAEQVSELTTNRLSVYLRCLNQLEDSGVRTISSQALAEQFHLNAAQIRKDLAYFGEFGVRGVGYYVRDLRRHLREKVGQHSRSGVPIYDIADLKKFGRRESVRIAVLAVPASSAQRVVDLVIAAGIKAILNFSPGALQVPDDVKLKDVDLTVSLESLSFYLARGESGGQ